jgi:hypothetical protein
MLASCAAALMTGGAAASEHRTTQPRGMFTYQGTCDASAAVGVDADRFLMADDESNILRLYRLGRREPLQAFDLNNHLGPELAWPEADIEAACRVGSRVYWITSHGRNSSGELRRSRYRFFATDLEVLPYRVNLYGAGRAYGSLVHDLIRAPQLTQYNFRELQHRAPKWADALNIEGLAGAHDGRELWIGFRNPVPRGLGLIVPLLNPDGVLEYGESAWFGEPVELDLGGMGIRSLEALPESGGYLIVAGGIDGERGFAVYHWSGNPSDAPSRYEGVEFGPMQPEAIATFPGLRAVLMLSDDGTRRIGESAGKEVANTRHRGFRTAWFYP